MKINKQIASSIAGASIVLTLLGVLSKGIGFIREIIYAHNFGLSSEFDLFLSSVALPNVINTAVIYLSQHYFIPGYNKLKIESVEKAEIYFNYTFWWFIIGGSLLSVILYFASGIIFHNYLSTVSYGMQIMGIKIFQLFLITIPLNAGMSIIMAYEQANFKFTIPAFSLIILNLFVIILVLLFSEVLSIYVLPFSFVVAYIVAFLFLIFQVKGKLKFNIGEILILKHSISELGTILSLIIIETMSLSYVLIDRYFIGNISQGGIAALNYAFVIYSLPISLFSLPLVTTMFSKFSNSPQTLSKDFKNSTGMNFFIMIPFVFILFFWGDYFLHLFYERGRFTSSNTLTTFSALRYYSFGLIFLTTYAIVVKIMYSLSSFKYVFIISITAFIIKLVLNIIFVKNLEQNGLALSTTIIYFFLCMSGLTVLFLNFKISQQKTLLFDLIYFLINASLSYLLVQTITVIFKFEMKLVHPLGVILFITVYSINTFLLNDDESKLIKNTVKKLLVSNF